MILREFQSTDGEACFRLFKESVRKVNSADYTPGQIAAWSDNSDFDSWTKRFVGHFVYVVVESNAIVGFSSMTRTGHLDRLFVSADHQRLGIATMLFDAMIDRAKSLSISSVTTDASITAKPFFESKGFSMVRQQEVECSGITLTKFSMNRLVQS